MLCEERKKRVSVLTQYVQLDTVGGKEIVWRIEDTSVYSVHVSVGSWKASLSPPSISTGTATGTGTGTGIDLPVQGGIGRYRIAFWVWDFGFGFGFGIFCFQGFPQILTSLI